MSTLIFRIVRGFQMGWMAFKQPLLFDKSNFTAMGKVFEIILKVGQERKPMMVHVAYMHPSNQEESDVVSIWAGSGVGANPIDRIKELSEENMKLKKLLAEEIKKSTTN